MKSAWDPILVLFIETILITAHARGHVEQRDDPDEIVGKRIFETSRYLSDEESAGKYRGYRKDYIAKIGTVAESLVDDYENDNKGDGSMPKTSAVSTTGTEMPGIDTRNTTDYRLPDDLEPFMYKLEIRMENENLFDGNVRIHALVNRSTAKIVLHVKEIKVHSVMVALRERILDVKDTLEIPHYNFFIIHLRQTLVKGVSVSIDIDYTGKLNGTKEGFYRSTYVDNSGETRWFAATRLAPIGARRMFPCFDEPRFTAYFKVSVRRPANYKVITSGTLLSSTIDGDGNILDTFDTVASIPVHLFSLVVGDFENLVDGNKQASFWATANVVKHGKFTLDMTVDLKKNYSRFFSNVPVPSPIAMVALPDFPFRPTENGYGWVHRESEILNDWEIASITTKYLLAGFISQEIIYWSISIAAPLSSWAHLWLSKGFARYFEYGDPLIFNRTKKFDAEFVVEQLHAAFECDARTSTHPIAHDVYSPAEISSTFDDIVTTTKSASILRMIRNIFGGCIFNTALQKYHKRRSFHPKGSDDYFTALQVAIKLCNEEFDIPIKPMMYSWMKQAGYPVVNVRIEGRVAYLEQKRFYSNGYEAETSNDDTWWIPVTWATQSNADFTKKRPDYWLTEKNGEVQLPVSSEWVIFNVQQTGFYRVNYDSASWKRIINVLKSNNHIRIHTINRAALINDILILAQAGQIDYATALSATQYLINETDYIPWRAAFNSLAYLNLQFKDKDNFELYKTHVLTILNPIYERLGFTESSSEKRHDMLLRIYVVEWACNFNVASCLSWSQRKFAMWKNNSTTIPESSRKTVYCTAIKHGSIDDWNFLRKQYTLTSSARERVDMLDGLGCSKLRTNIERLLLSAITKNSKMRFEDSLRAFAAVYSSSSIGTEYALKFVARNLLNLHEYYQDESSIDSILNGISSALATKQLLLKMEDFVETQRKTLTEIGLSPDKYLQTAYETASWYERYSPLIYEWLDKSYPSIDYRLPTKIHPRSYDIYLRPYLNDHDSFFDGQTVIKMDVIANTSSIVLHASALKLKTIMVFIDSTKAVQILSYTIDKVTDLLKIYLTTVVAAGTELFVHIVYSGLISDDMYGFYRSSYIDKNGKTRWLASTQFQPVYARRAFPCFDEPAFKAKFAIHIERPNDYQTLSNMRRLASVRSTSPKRTWDSYEWSVPMSSYMVAFVVSDFESPNSLIGNYSIWAPPGTVKFGEYALDVGQKVLRFLAKYTGIDNPMEKIDLIAIPDFHSGGMANWGLMTFRDYGLLGNENVTSARLMKYIHTLVARKTVNAWFGNLVTCDWWDHVWLQEGFAQYFQWTAGHKVSPRWKLLQQFVVYEMHPAMVRDALSPRSMNSQVFKPSDIASNFIPHEKSASIIRMLRHALGKRVFKSALRTYLEERKWKTAKPDHLLSAIEIHNDSSVKTIIESWTNNMGYPVVNATWEAGALTLTQERFVFPRRNVITDHRMDNKFWIPITMTTKSHSNFRNTQPRSWLTNTFNSSLILEKDEWFIINIQGTGFYRVNYDVNSWNRIIAGLMSHDFDGIHEVNRAQIIDDLFNLARADYVAYDLALSASAYLVKEDNHLAWAAFFEAVSFLRGRFYKHNVGRVLSDYVVMLLERAYNKIGFVDLPDEQHMDRLNREMLLRWSCRLGYNHCINSAIELYKEWRRTGIKGISPNARPAVYCTLVYTRDSDGWNLLWNEYVKTELGSEKIVILNALACSKNSTTLHDYLKLAISSDNVIRDQDVPEIFNSVLHANDFGVDVMLGFLVRYYNELHSFYGDWAGVTDLIQRVAAEIFEEAQIRKLDTIIRNVRRELDEENTSSMLSAIDTAKANLEWIQAHKMNIEASLMRIRESIDHQEQKNSGRIQFSNWTFATVVFYLVFCHTIYMCAAQYMYVYI